MRAKAGKNMDIVLIGMMGCGKTTLGRRLAKQLDMEFADTDAEIEKAEGRSISDIFKSDGEGYFRRVETECLKRVLGKDRVIATGGGVVVADENHRILKDSDVLIIFIDRPVEDIMGDIKTDSRPLLKDGAEPLIRLRGERYDKYMDLCSIRVLNNKPKQDVIKDIIKEVKTYENNGNKRS